MATVTAPARTARAPRTPARERAQLLGGLLAVLALIALSLGVGAYDLRGDDFGSELFWITRFPRTAALVLAGCAMAVSGMVMQQLTSNRFVEPTTTGTTEWAGLGLLLAAILVPTASLPLRMVFASLSAFVGTAAFLFVLRRIRLRSSLVVPLIGIMMGAVVSAFSTYLAVTTNLLQYLGTWFMGSFTPVVRGRYEALWVVLVVVIAVYLFSDRLTVAGLGKDTATSLGVNHERTLLLGTALVAIASGVTTVVVGFLPFLGLIVPNLVSMWRGDNLRRNLPWVCLLGVAILILCDVVGRVIRAPFDVPVSMILGVLGAAVFLFLLLRRPVRD